MYGRWKLTPSASTGWQHPGSSLCRNDDYLPIAIFATSQADFERFPPDPIDHGEFYARAIVVAMGSIEIRHRKFSSLLKLM